MRRVRAACEVTLVTNHGIVGAGPPQSWNHAAGQLVGEQVRRDGAASSGAGQARGAERPVTCRRHPANSDPAQVVCSLVALGFEPGDDNWVVEPRPPPPLRHADRLWLTDEDELLCPTRRVGYAGQPRDRKRSTVDRRHSHATSAPYGCYRRSVCARADNERQVTRPDLLGHSSISITGDIYRHTSDATTRAAVDGLTDALGL